MKRCSVCGEVKAATDFCKKQTKCKPCYAAYFREYRAKNQRRTNEQSYRYIKSAKGKASQARYQKSEAGQQRHRMNQQRRRARLLGNGVYQVSPKDMRRLQAQECSACGGAGQHIDHIIPVSRGGRHAIGNLQMLCAPCNLSKKDKVMTEWRAYLALVAA